jgi:hypothetical protein
MTRPRLLVLTIAFTAAGCASVGRPRTEVDDCLDHAQQSYDTCVERNPIRAAPQTLLQPSGHENVTNEAAQFQQGVDEDACGRTLRSAQDACRSRATRPGTSAQAR